MPAVIDQQITFLSVFDLEESHRFYNDILGFKIILDQGACRIYRVCGDSYLGVCEKGRDEINTECIIYTFVTEDVESWYKFLLEKGVNIVKAPELNSKYNIYHFFFRDPDGYLLEVQKFLDPGWPQKGLAE